MNYLIPPKKAITVELKFGGINGVAVLEPGIRGVL